MRVIRNQIKGEPITINVVDSPDDLPAFKDFVESNRRLLGWDTETTGLDWWNWDRDFRVRLAQFGNASESYVLPVEREPVFGHAARWALWAAERLVAHNGTFDRHVAKVSWDVPMEALARKSWDSKLTGHLVDGRGPKGGGPSMKLEDQVGWYISAEDGKRIKGSMAELAKELKTTKARVFKEVPLDHPTYLLYAGADPMWTYRLLAAHWTKIKARTRPLIPWEHQLAHITAEMEHLGVLLDEEYAKECVEQLRAEEDRWKEVARSLGVENIQSGRQIAEALLRDGVKLKDRTPSGEWATGESVLKEIDHPLCEAIIKGKAASKKRTTWFENALANVDSRGRVHPSINSLEARTSRMSITGAFPAQTVPAGDSYVRHMFLAEEEDLWCAIDYGNMELRGLAGWAQDPTMLKAFHENLDLHDMTATAAFGPMPEGGGHHPKRKAGKGTNYTVCFGGGWNAVHTQWDIHPEDAKKAVKAFWEAYPRAKKLSNKLMEQARRQGGIYTATGRWVPVDQERPYAALNYFVQGSCRDITARALIQLHEAAMIPYARLPVHDEIVFSFPRRQADDLAQEARRLMEFTVGGLLIPADPEIGKRSWGSVIDAENSKH